MMPTSAALHDEGLEVRVGIHAGDIERRDTNVSGIAVHIAARIMALAGPAEILTSEAVRLVATGAGIRFEDRGRHRLKGVSDPWQLHAVVPTPDSRSDSGPHAGRT